MITALLPYFLIPLGFVLLVKGADFLIDGAVSIAKKLGAPELVIGLTVVAFGTSAPELVVNVVSSLKGASGIVVGNIVGSNIANLALNLGVTGLFAALMFEKTLLRKEVPLSLLAAAAVWFLAAPAGDTLVLGLWGGVALLAGFLVFLAVVFQGAKEGKGLEDIDPAAGDTTLRASGKFIVGLGGLVLGGKLVVDNAVAIAASLGVSEAMIGLTIVAIGTSLPELVTSVVAALKGRLGLAIGNAIGSNVFNIFWVLGISAVINPVVYDRALGVDLLVLGGVTLLTIGLPFLAKDKKIRAPGAALLVLSYIAYMVFVVLRG